MMKSKIYRILYLEEYYRSQRHTSYIARENKD